MGRNKSTRTTITLECSQDKLNKINKRRNGIFRYTTSKNKRNTINRLELRKFCPICNCHTTFREIK